MENGRIKVWLPAIRAHSGADVFTQRLAQALEQRGMATHITWFTRYDELIPIRLMRAKPPAGTDVVLANSWNGYAFKRAGLPLIVTVHHAIFEPELDSYKSFWQKLYHRYVAQPRELRSLRAADGVTTVSAYVADRVRERYGIEDVQVIYNWVDTEKFCPAQRPDQQTKPFRLLFVGKPTLLKGADLFAPIMRELGPAFELYVTDGEEECRWLDFPPDVHYLDRLSEADLIWAYRDCNAVLLPSRSEGFGYAALEAMACGKPVIAANGTGLQEVVVDGATGFLCATDSVREFVAVCRKLSETPCEGEQMGMLARNSVLERFSQDEMAERYISLIHRLI